MNGITAHDIIKVLSFDNSYIADNISSLIMIFGNNCDNNSEKPTLINSILLRWRSGV